MWSVINKYKNTKVGSHVSDFFTPKSISQFLKYLVVGFSSFAIEISSYIFLFEHFFVRYQPKFYLKFYDVINPFYLSYGYKDLAITTYRALVSNILVYCVIFWFVFMMNRFWSFKSKGKFLKQAIQYGILFAFNLIVINTAIFYYITDILGINAIITKIVVVGLQVSWNFIIYKKVIYK